MWFKKYTRFLKMVTARLTLGLALIDTSRRCGWQQLGSSLCIYLISSNCNPFDN
jgi:hypothetical protein